MGKIVLERLWEKVAKTGIKTIDDEHRKLIDIINMAIDAAHDPTKSPANMRDVFIDLMGYARSHFWTEEELMFKFKYDGYESHKKAHWEFTKAMINLSFDYVEGKTNVDEDIITFLETWLIEHVVDEDIKFVKLFKENGVE